VIKVLVVDDSALVRKLFGRVLEGEPEFEVSFARNGVEALAQLTTFAPDVVTLDIQMPVMDGIACLDRIMIERPCPVVMVSSLTAEGADLTLEALRLGAVDFIPKPEGAVSLHMEVFAPELIAKIRSAAKSKLKSSLRLRERVRHRIGVRKSKSSEQAQLRQSGLKRPAGGTGIVLVGTSTGGPPALEALLIPLASSFPWPIVIAQHMPASFTGALAQRLDRICQIRVQEVLRPTVLEPGYAYIGHGDADIVIAREGRSILATSVPSDKDYRWHPSADRLVQSALDLLSPGLLIGILMTGMGNDGAATMTELHDQGGCTIAEAEETAVVWGMPGELVAARGADWVLPVQGIADKLQQLVTADAAHPNSA
jgi:two-component system chemotaxis response regulator CheB